MNANTPQGTGEAASNEERLVGILGDDLDGGLVDHTAQERDDEEDNGISDDGPSPSEDTPEFEEAETEPQAEPDEEGEEATYTVTVNGEQVKVTRDELLKGYSRQSDYTRKAQEIAAERAKIQAELQQLEPIKQQLMTAYQSILGEQEQEPDWDTLKREDPYEFQQKAAEWQIKERQKAQIAQHYQALQQEQAKRTQAQEAAYLQQQESKLLELKPEWAKPEIRQKETGAIVSYLTSEMGLTQDEVEFVSKGDARYIAVIDKARKWDALQKQKPQAQAKVQNKPTVRPGTSSSKASRQADTLQASRNRLRKTGNVKDAANAFNALLGKDLD